MEEFEDCRAMSEPKTSAAKTLEYLKKKQLNMEFHLKNTDYRAIQNIGTGAYGVVCKAVDTRTQKQVAIKKIAKAFAIATLVKRTLREVRMLRHFNHENIVAILDMFHAQGSGPEHQGPDIYMVMDLMETDLHQIIHSKQPLTEQHFQYFLYQILRGLKYIHSAGVVHRDLKPSNLLVNADCMLKICDFGMARSIEQPVQISGNYMTQYVATRWYRAPELLFSMLEYSAAVDIWSVGCIFAEMIMRRQLFPGKDFISQVKMIVFYLGTPESEVLSRISSEVILRWIESCGDKQPLPWPTILPKATHDALTLVANMLQIAPWKRMTAEQCLEQPYLSAYHDVRYEPNCSERVMIETDSIEHLHIDQLKKALENEAFKFEEKAAALKEEQKQVSNRSNGQQTLQAATTSQSQVSDADVEMLSAAMNSLESSDQHQQSESTSNATNNNHGAAKDVRTALREALQKKMQQQQQQQQAAMDKNVSVAQNNDTTKTKKKIERKRKSTGSTKQQKPEVEPDGEQPVTEEDKKLLERWEQIQKHGQQQRIEGEIISILSKTCPSPADSAMSNTANAGEDGETPRASDGSLDSAALMRTWQLATDLDQQQLQDIQMSIDAQQSP